MKKELIARPEDLSVMHNVPYERPTTIDNRHVLILAFACAIAVANLYYIQPLLASLAHGFSVSVNQIGFIATLSQLGYASGLLLIVPLGDRYNQRTLIVGMSCAVAIALLIMAIAPSIAILAIASYLVGLTTVVPQLIIPFAASLAPDEMRGRVVGAVMSGLLIGILLARTVSGFIGEWLGWRAMYLIAMVMMIILAIGMRFLLPDDKAPKGNMSYPRLMQSLWHLLKAEPVLQETAVFGAILFGVFSAFWVTLSFVLETSPYHYGSDVAGLFGLVGVAGALSASFVGKFADRKDARFMNGLAILITLISFLLMWFAGQWLIGLIIGVILLDLGTQSNQVANQTRVYSLRPEARSRLNTVYMTLYFIGGSLGSLLGTYGWSIGKWNGVCSICVGLLLIVAAFFILHTPRIQWYRQR